MKAMILVLSPEECVKLLNGDLSILVRKKFSKDFVGWVYIYVTKKYDNCLFYNSLAKAYCLNYGKPMNDYLNGKVVAKVWCNKVEEIEAKLTALGYAPYTKTLSMPDLLKNSCLTIKDLNNYLQGKNGYAIHITKLEIFDKPREIAFIRPKPVWKTSNNHFYICYIEE